MKFDYAAISADDLRKQLWNPTDAELQEFFKQNPARYASADPETRKIQYVAFDSKRAVPEASPTSVTPRSRRTTASTKTSTRSRSRCRPGTSSSRRRRAHRCCKTRCRCQGQGRGRARAVEVPWRKVR